MKQELKIFIIEDDTAFAKILSGIVENVTNTIDAGQCTISYEMYYSSSEADFELRRNPDIVLMDYYLINDELQPDTAITILRDIKRYKESIDVIVISGQHDEKTTQMLLENGANHYLGKDPESLLRLKKILSTTIRHKIGGLDENA